jgi:hypothetical protein
MSTRSGSPKGCNAPAGEHAASRAHEACKRGPIPASHELVVEHAESFAAIPVKGVRMVTVLGLGKSLHPS